MIWSKHSSPDPADIGNTLWPQVWAASHSMTTNTARIRAYYAFVGAYTTLPEAGKTVTSVSGYNSIYRQ